MMGAKIGRRAAIKTVSQMSPKLTHIGAQSFFADGSMIGGNRIHRGLLELRESRIGHRSFVGNGAILPVGASLGNECLLGLPFFERHHCPAHAHARWDGVAGIAELRAAAPPRALSGRASTRRRDLTSPTRKLIHAALLLIDALRIVLPDDVVTGFSGRVCGAGGWPAEPAYRLPAGRGCGLRSSHPLIESRAVRGGVAVCRCGKIVTLIGAFACPRVQAVVVPIRVVQRGDERHPMSRSWGRCSSFWGRRSPRPGCG